MKLFQNFRKRLADKAIAGYASKRQGSTKPISLEKASSLGILFAMENDVQAKITRLLQQPPLKDKRISLLGYNPVKPLKENNPGNNSFSVKDLNWLFKPKGEKVETFLNLTFDALIDLSTKDHYPLLYIMSQAKSNINISMFSDKKKMVADLMIEMDKDADPLSLFEQINFYVNQLNAPKNETGF